MTAEETTLRLPECHLTQKTHNVIFVPVDYFQAGTSCELLHRFQPAAEFLVGMNVGVIEEAKDPCSFILQYL